MVAGNILSAGEEIDSWCLKCKDITNHTIIAMEEEKIAKVLCNVCRGRHNYRPAQPGKTKKESGSAEGTTAKTKTPLSVRKAADSYAKMLNGRNLEEAVPYAMTSLFSKNDLVDHPTFGLGLVTAIIPPNKIESTFNEGPRILVCQLKGREPIAPGSGVKAKRRKMVRKNIDPML